MRATDPRGGQLLQPPSLTRHGRGPRWEALRLRLEALGAVTAESTHLKPEALWVCTRGQRSPGDRIPHDAEAPALQEHRCPRSSASQDLLQTHIVPAAWLRRRLRAAEGGEGQLREKGTPPTHTHTPSTAGLSQEPGRHVGSAGSQSGRAHPCGDASLPDESRRPGQASRSRASGDRPWALGECSDHCEPSRNAKPRVQRAGEGSKAQRRVHHGTRRSREPRKGPRISQPALGPPGGRPVYRVGGSRRGAAASTAGR